MHQQLQLYALLLVSLPLLSLLDIPFHPSARGDTAHHTEVLALNLYEIKSVNRLLYDF